MPLSFRVTTLNVEITTTMLTTKQKDDILFHLISKEGGAILTPKSIATAVGVSEADVNKVINYLERKKLIVYNRMSDSGDFTVDIPIEGEDFYKKGGFEYEETLAQMELNKLMLELESLERLIPKEKYERLMQGLGVIISALSLAKQ